jgi:hypothetical protein
VLTVPLVPLAVPPPYPRAAFFERPADSGRNNPDSGVGIDTIAVSGPASPRMIEALREQRVRRTRDDAGRIDERRTASETVVIGGAHVQLQAFHDTPRLKVELSAPNVLRGHNGNAAPPDLLPDVLDAVLSDLAFWLPDVPTVEQVMLTRLDLVRDFHQVSSPSDVLAVLERRPVARISVQSTYYIPGTCLRQTIVRGTQRWRASGYAKGPELAYHASSLRGEPERRQLLQEWAAVSSGQLRFELQLRKLHDHPSLRCPLTVTAAQMQSIVERYFERLQWHLPYGSAHTSDTLAALGRTEPAAQMRNLQSFLDSRRRGLPYYMSKNRKDDAMRLARRHGLLGEDGAGVCRRLDLASGREVFVD